MDKIVFYFFVKKVEFFYKLFLKLEFELKFDKVKEYDYKIGI